jgi:hypothetical protein
MGGDAFGDAWSCGVGGGWVYALQLEGTMPPGEVVCAVRPDHWRASGPGNGC